MAAPVDSRLVGIMDDVTDELALMGRENGFRRDYAGVVRHLFARGLEDDPHNSEVQIGMLGTSEVTIYGNLFRPMDEFVVQIHVAPEERNDGQLDLIRPTLNARADIFQALIVDSARTRGLGRVMTYWLRSDKPGLAADADVIGGTVREVYGIQWDFSDAGMDVEP